MEEKNVPEQDLPAVTGAGTPAAEPEAAEIPLEQVAAIAPIAEASRPITVNRTGPMPCIPKSSSKQIMLTSSGTFTCSSIRTS